jgi:hypothetical protein
MAGLSRFRLPVCTGSEAEADYKQNGSKDPFFKHKAAEARQRQCVNPAPTCGIKCVELYLRIWSYDVVLRHKDKYAFILSSSTCRKYSNNDVRERKKRNKETN